jgi:acetyl/propionyl-CoA carboxylase alpha subunit
VDYQGAGTVEFLLGAGGDFHFLEMNTRLQVEHPVTELVTGTDLVRAQIRVAEGHPLPWSQADLTTRGHAIECRIYAEDPARGFLPSLGDILLLHEPAGPGVRIDSGVRQGDRVGMYYDPLLAKLSVHGEDRPAAIERAVTALRDFAVLGVTTNVAYLLAILQEPAFGEGRLHTGFLDEHLPAWTGERDDDGDLALLVAAIDECDRRQHGGGPGSAGDPRPAARRETPWRYLKRFRMSGLD